MSNQIMKRHREHMGTLYFLLSIVVRAFLVAQW